MKIKLYTLKAFMLGALAMVAFKWVAHVLVAFSDDHFELTMSLAHFAFLVGVGLLIVIGIVFILID